MKILYPSLLAALVAIALPPPDAHAGKPRLAIPSLEVIADGRVEHKTVKLAEDLSNALRKRASVGAGPYKLSPGSKKSLPELKMIVGCESESPACMAKMGMRLNADVLLYGKLQRRKNGYQISLVILDVRAKKRLRTTTELIPLDATSPARVNKWARQLYNRTTGVPEQGTLLVSADVPTGVVYINGEVKGSLTDGKLQISGVAEGTMEVRVEADGYKPFSTEVTVKGGGVTEVEVTLGAPEELPPPPRGKRGCDATSGTSSTGLLLFVAAWLLRRRRSITAS